ncbi:hypothetical protein V7146_16265 [Gottfriedia acidiceleris]|uniref:hypothetical protein n=1 Tax=Gottfriedia acidiceleris TaxID=371036 RepID=UPI003000CC73
MKLKGPLLFLFGKRVYTYICTTCYEQFESPVKLGEPECTTCFQKNFTDLIEEEERDTKRKRIFSGEAEKEYRDKAEAKKIEPQEPESTVVTIQTKEQALGYILYASYRANVSPHELSLIGSMSAKVLRKVDAENIEINGDVTFHLLMDIADVLGFKNELKDEMGTELFLSFETKTLDEAEEMIDIFIKLGV